MGGLALFHQCLDGEHPLQRQCNAPRAQLSARQPAAVPEVLTAPSRRLGRVLHETQPCQGGARECWVSQELDPIYLDLCAEPLRQHEPPQQRGNHSRLSAQEQHKDIDHDHAP
jgi:hypothetical protein